MKTYKLSLKDINPKLAKKVEETNKETKKEIKRLKNKARNWIEVIQENVDTKTFKEWLSDSGYRPTIGTPRSPSGLPDFHTKDDDRGYGVIYSTVELCIEFIDLNEAK